MNGFIAEASQVLDRPPSRATSLDAAPERSFSIRAWLLALSILCILPAAVLALALVLLDYRRGRQEIEAHTLGTARALVAVVDRQVGQVQAGLEGLATSPLLQQGLTAQFHEQAGRFQRSQSLALNVVLIDERRRQIVNTLRPMGAELPSGNEPRQLTDILTHGRPVVTDMFAGPVAQRSLCAIGVPVRNGPRIMYVLAAGIDPLSIRQVLERQGLPAGWIAVVLDTSGTIVARSVEHPRFAGEKATEELVRRAALAAEGSFEGVTKEGIPVQSVFSRSASTGWTVAIGIPKRELEAPLLRSLAWLAASTLGLLAVSVAFAWGLGARVSESISKLVTASVQLGRGEKVDVPRLAFEEANQLGRAMALAGVVQRMARDDADGNAARLAAVLESAMDAAVVVDERNRIVTFNAAASRSFRYLPEEAIGMDFDLLFPLVLRGHRSEWLDRLPDTGSRALQGRAGELLMGLTREGRPFPIEASVSKATVGRQRFLVMFIRETARD